MTREEAFELIPLYAVGVLDEDEVRAVENFIRDASTEEQHELSEWREVVAMLPLALPQIAPPEHLRVRLLDRITEAPDDQKAELLYRIVDSQTTPVVETTAKVLPFTPLTRKFESDPQRWLLMAASILLACTSAFLFWRNGYVAGQRDSITADRDRMAVELDQEKKEKEAIYASLTASSKIVPMDGVETPEANARIVWDMKQQVWKIFIVNLPAPPSDKDYQLWYVTNNQKISAAVFSTDSRGQTMLILTLPPQALKGLALTAVTLEPKGGSPQPTGKFYLKAAI